MVETLLTIRQNETVVVFPAETAPPRIAWFPSNVQRVIVTPLVAVSTTIAPPLAVSALLPMNTELLMFADAALRLLLAMSMAPPPPAAELATLLMNVQPVTVSTPVPIGLTKSVELYEIAPPLVLAMLA